MLRSREPKELRYPIHLRLWLPYFRKLSYAVLMFLVSWPPLLYSLDIDVVK
jgi:hypothetical protein